MAKLGAIRTHFANWLCPISMVALFCAAAVSAGADEATTRSFNVSEHPADALVDEATPAAASIGNRCLVVWKDNRGDNQPYHRGSYLLYGRRFDLNGNALDATSFQIQEEPFVWNNEGVTLPTVGTLGRDYLVIWLTRLRQVSAKLISKSGNVAAQEIPIARTGSASGQPTFASTRRNGLVVWTERVNNNGDIYATLLDRNGMVRRLISVAVGPANAQYPIVAAAGRNYLVVWRELSATLDGHLKAALVAESGEVRPLDDFPAAVALRAAVASNRRNYFVAWQTDAAESGCELMGYTLNWRGEMTQRMPLAATGEQSLPSVMSSGTDFTVLWRENPYSDDAMLYSLTVPTRGLPTEEPSATGAEMGWSGFGLATSFHRSNMLVVLEQKTPDYDDNGYLSRVRAGIVIKGR